jgi:hypothetical protein
MSTTQRFGKPYVWVTWITGPLSGDKQCQWAPWFKARYKYGKRPDPTFNSAVWTAEHNALVARRKAELAAEGFIITIESQNEIKLHGKTTLLAGKPDLVAVRGLEWRVIDCKTGKPRLSDFWQVLIYMLTLPKTRLLWTPDRVVYGEVCYPSHQVAIGPEALTAERSEQIYAQLRILGSDVRPAKTPSRQECQFCDIGEQDCPERWSEVELPAATTEEF